jgi:hypothetical protein
MRGHVKDTAYAENMRSINHLQEKTEAVSITADIFCACVDRNWMPAAHLPCNERSECPSVPAKTYWAAKHHNKKVFKKYLIFTIILWTLCTNTNHFLTTNYFCVQSKWYGGSTPLSPQLPNNLPPQQTLVQQVYQVVLHSVGISWYRTELGSTTALKMVTDCLCALQ